MPDVRYVLIGARAIADGFHVSDGRILVRKVSVRPDDLAAISQQAEFTPRDVHTKEERTKLVFAPKLAPANPEGVLKPGMPADAKIRWDARAPVAR